MIFPIYSSLAGLGGIIAYSIKRSRKEKDQSPNKLQISLLALLPICLGFAEGDRTSVSRECVIACELVIDATPQEVWHQLTHIDSIKANEHHGGVTGLLGFPTHQSTRLDNVAVGGSRVATFEKGLVFYEKVTQCIPEKQLALSIKTLPDQIAADVLDEHIVIGGKHLNMLGDVYELQSMPGGKCKITLSSRFVICTPFNWYASIWAHWLMNDVLQSELSLIAQRCAEQKKDS
ncbi:hypothetical protein FLA_2924 [Filimonas lacunae]|nr:hypothetical protein FLA_2924 [Filimonas lacunae]